MGPGEQTLRIEKVTWFARPGRHDLSTGRCDLGTGRHDLGPADATAVEDRSKPAVVLSCAQLELDG
ncbi:hypothetical protein FG87_42030 [Nocardia vulneris]|uniref:Uncharacterized protein n=1 Tax=Nocardia vulneris TaxID=1141657 RepID=A0ABR4Z2M3_9NOCA|nr:hypothetical protein FG87_42030 [Nocardia vulneris]